MREQENWRMRAACRHSNPELFFPEGTAGPALAAADLAKRTCGTCPVQAQCLNWALDHGAVVGIWGGLSEGERRDFRYVRRIDPGPAADDRLIEVQATAIRAVCDRLTPAQLEGMRRSVEHACLMPRSIEWDRKAAAHAEIFALLAKAADHPLLAQALNSGAGFVHHLMVTAGPATGRLTASSRKRLLAFLLARNPEGAAREMESYLRVLRFMGRLADLLVSSRALVSWASMVRSWGSTGRRVAWTLTSCQSASTCSSVMTPRYGRRGRACAGRAGR